MHHQFWLYRDGKLVVQKYVGVFDIEAILKYTNTVFSSIPQDRMKILNLADISEARFPNLTNENYREVFEALNNHMSISSEMQIAIYTGMNQFEDFRVAIDFANFTKLGPFTVIPFNMLESSMNWLGLTQKEQETITEQLQNFM